MPYWWLHLTHLLRCYNRGCIMCRLLHHRTERYWMWYIVIAWAMLYLAMMRG